MFIFLSNIAKKPSFYNYLPSIFLSDISSGNVTTGGGASLEQFTGFGLVEPYMYNTFSSSNADTYGSYVPQETMGRASLEQFTGFGLVEPYMYNTFSSSNADTYGSYVPQETMGACSTTFTPTEIVYI
jgi:hypothetical protein